MSAEIIGGGFLLAGGVLAGGSVLALRQRSYRSHLKFAPKQNCIARFAGGNVESVQARCDSRGFVVPEFKAGVTSAFLELDLRASLAGSLLDPCVTIEAGEFRDTQTLERGLAGVRFINVTRLLASGVKPSDFVTLRGARLSWREGTVQLHLCRERVQPGERVLVVAPHPDDAEIAAFGLYADTDATVVTLTAGEGSDRYTGAGGMSVCLRRSTIARMRVWDSLTVPVLGGVPQEKVLNLAYPDGCLRRMRAEPERDFRGVGEEALDYDGLRRLNRSSLVRAQERCSWKSLVNDLTHLLAAVNPSIIAVPHPCLDPHSDHLMTTAAVCDALQSSGASNGRFYFYVNHNRRSELWPFGPAGSGVAMIPLFADDAVECDGFYSHSLTPARQQEKFLALEAMHDLRELGTPEPAPARVYWKRSRAAVAAALHGTGHPPTSYLRRAVRPDELFFTTGWVKGRELCKRALATA